ncbi:hypothetical protein MMC25_004209 [Agyrium rufum]|nr:hypothetical protein [Agyrium rufum]
MDNERYSQEPFPFSKSDEEVIIRTSAYHRRDFDLAVARVDSREHEAVRESMTNSFERSSSSGNLGTLSTLPVEMIVEIYHHLDAQSLFRFRQVCLRTREMVSLVSEYQTFVKYALDVLCVVLRSDLGQHHTFRRMYATLCTLNCDSCDDFGGFVFLPSFTRCCISCIRSNPLVCVTTLHKASQSLLLSPRKLQQLVPVMRTLTGIYSMTEAPPKRRNYLLSRMQVLKALESEKVTNRQRHLSRLRSAGLRPPGTMYQYMASTALAYLAPSTGEVQRGICCTGCQILVEQNWVRRTRYETVYKDQDRVYSKQGYLDHFSRCIQSQQRWSESRGGMVAIEGSAFASRGGYFGKRDDVTWSYH